MSCALQIIGLTALDVVEKCGGVMLCVLNVSWSKSLLAQMEERTWKAELESTADEQWDRLSEMVRQEIAVGDITIMDWRTCRV